MKRLADSPVKERVATILHSGMEIERKPNFRKGRVSLFLWRVFIVRSTHDLRRSRQVKTGKMFAGMALVLFAFGMIRGVDKNTSEQQSAKGRRVGMYTDDQIKWRSERIARSLWKGTTGYILTSSPSYSENKAGKKVVLWHVECATQSGIPLGTMNWNAENGQMLHLTSASIRPPYRRRLLTSESVKSVASTYSRVVGMSIHGLTEMKVQGDRTCLVRGISEKGSVWLYIDRESGLLREALCHPKRQTLAESGKISRSPSQFAEANLNSSREVRKSGAF